MRLPEPKRPLYMVDGATRSRISSRSLAWTVSYGTLAAVGLLVGSQRIVAGGGNIITGLVVAALGYDIGRWMLRNAPHRPPPEPAGREVGALAVVAVGEELTWGAIVEPALGPVVTAALFAVKHPLIDGRWRRILGLAAFWFGLAMVREQSPMAALIAHVALNVSGVLRGHLTERDQF